MLQSRTELLAEFEKDGFTPREDTAWEATWLPFTLKYRVALMTGTGQTAPVDAFSMDLVPGDLEPPSESLGDLVATWTAALEHGATLFDADAKQFVLDGQVARAHGLRLDPLL